MKPIKWLANLLTGVILGIILTVGGIAAGGYIMLTKSGMVGTIEDKTGGKIPNLELSDEVRAMSLLDYGKHIFEQLQNINTATLEEIEAAIGYSGLSDMLSSSLGIDEQEILASTIPGLPDCIVNAIRVRTLQENFGVEFPDFPLFQDEEFLDKKITEAFSGFGDEDLDRFITVVYDDDPDASKPRSSKFIQKLGKEKMTELSSNLDGILADTAVGEIITITEESEPIIKALKDTKLNSNDLNNAMQNLSVNQIFKDYDTGVLSLISPDTNIQAIPATLSGAITDTCMYQLVQLGIYSVSLDSASPDAKASMYNKSPSTIIAEYAAITINPANAAVITAPRQFVISGQITQAVIAGIAGFRNGDTLVLDNDAYIAGGEVFTSLFNIDTNGYNLLIGTGAAIDNSGGYMYIKGYSGQPVVITSLQSIKKSPTVTVDAVMIEFIA